jgi:hypothetical protein
MTSIVMVNQWHRRRLAKKAMDAYLSWREQCIAVRTAYSYWEAARASDSALWYEAYSSALDREERASELYAGLAGRIGRPVVVDFETVAGVFAAGGLR